MIKILIDSGIDQNKWMKASYEYDFLPLSVIINESDYLDQVEISLKEVHGYMQEGVMPKTSQVSPETVLSTLDKCRERGEDVIYIALTGKVSGTYQVARTIAESYTKTHPEMNIAVIDSKGGAGGGALLAIQALEMVNKGFDYETIVKEIEESTNHIHYHFTLDNLKWLVKGGRLTKTAGIAGDALNIKPYLSINEEGIYLKKLVRGKDRIYKRIVKDVEKGVGSFNDQLIAISHVNNLENVRKLEKMIKEALPEATIQVFEIGSVLAAHLGIGGVGVFYYDKKPDHYSYIDE